MAITRALGIHVEITEEDNLRSTIEEISRIGNPKSGTTNLFASVLSITPYEKKHDTDITNKFIILYDISEI
jgi:hypothetical protein